MCHRPKHQHQPPPDSTTRIVPEQKDDERDEYLMNTTTTTTTTTEAHVNTARQHFFTLMQFLNNNADDNNNNNNTDGPSSLVINKAALLQTGIATKIATEYLKLDTEDELFNQWQEDVDFYNFFVTLSLLANESSSSSSSSSYSSATQILESIVSELPVPPLPSLFQSPAKQKHVESYLHMVQSFQEWEGFVIPNNNNNSNKNNSQNRRLDVLRGCFVGARNPKVVLALQIVYVDYSALRFAGNLIFKLMSAIVNRQKN
uniref:Uncharacterized protein n=1 Tax=Cyclophora tenuis TaxID=216820 RepID=A0A7S1GGK4_CYCTE